jgi:phosphatidylcholine synthase
MIIRKIFAWAVHFYTALGLVAAAGIAVLLVRGGAESFRQAFILMITATVIDATDGWLARKARVEEFAPTFDGRRLDDLIDFHTYTTLPLLLIWRAEILPPHLAWWLLLPLLALSFPIYYLGLSWVISLRYWRSQRRRATTPVEIKMEEAFD